MRRSGSSKEWAPLRLSGLAGLGVYALLWIAMWGSINSGPWAIVGEKTDLAGWVNAIRASTPLAVLLLWFVLLPLRPDRRKVVTGTEVLWVAYALLMLGSVFQTDRWFIYGYWAFAYLGVFAAIDITFRFFSVPRALDMVRFNWLLGTLFLLAMLVFARDVLLVEGETGLTAYNVDQRASSVAGVTISKTSGMARLAIVPAVVGLVFLFQARGATRMFWAAVCSGAALMIWLFQTRQGIFGMAFAFGFVLLLGGGRARIAGVALSLLAGLFLISGALPEDVVDYVTEHATRGEDVEALQAMTGRDRLWQMGWQLVAESPWIGHGPQADRRLIYQNVSNGPLYAAVCAGYPGMVLYVGGLLWGWVLFGRVFLRRQTLSVEERAFLLQVGGIMAYLTIRNIPENTASFYSVDLILHATMVAALGALEWELRRRRMTGAALRSVSVRIARSRLAAAGVRKSARG